MKSVIIILLIGIIMAISNPTKEEYVEWAQEQTMKESDGFLEKGIVSMFGESHFENSTTTNNYVVLSVFKTKVNETTVTTIGVFKNFIPVSY